ncbi:pyridoxal-dependent decarboxylase [Micromonospora echinofusca]|uniref:pyridoxal-dependent decarboxylase n=1 Tax=Micromonospora echinofusca TaxID=47858 RepID=UPI0034198AAE
MGDLENGWTISDAFPAAGLSPSELTAGLDRAYAETTGWDDPTVTRLGFAMSAPHQVALSAWTRFLALNSNNVGVHTPFGAGRAGTRRLEREALLGLAGLLHADSADGYITSGATEAVLQGLRIGRNAVRADAASRVTLITSEFAHHSVTKAAEVLSLDLRTIAPGPSWVIEPEQLAQAVEAAVADGATGIIVALTAGYYNSGLCDPVDQLAALLRRRALQLADQVRFFCYVDAAHGGFIFPFTDPAMAFDFRNVGVHAMALDPHKSGLLPYSCGVLLMRKGLLGHVAEASPVTGIVDSTLTGSRPGAAAAALWATVFGLGRSGFTAAIQECLRRRDLIVDAIRAADPEAEIRPAPASPVVVAGFSTPDGLLPKEFTERYRLLPVSAPAPAGGRRNYHHFYAGHSLTDEQIARFATGLSQAVTQARAERAKRGRVRADAGVPEQLRDIAADTDCFRHYIVHPPGRRDPDVPGYSFHTFLHRSATGEPLQVREWGETATGRQAHVYAPDLADPFGNELFGVRTADYYVEVLDRSQQKLSLVGGVHFCVGTGAPGERVLMNLENTGEFRSLEYKFGEGELTDEIQCFRDRIVVKLGKSARGFRRRAHSDEYSFSIDTSFECTIELADDDRPARLDVLRVSGDPLLPRRTHLLRQEYQRFPNRFFDIECTVVVGARSKDAWRLSDLVAASATDALVARSGLVGRCVPDVSGSAGELVVTTASLPAGRRTRMAVDTGVGRRMARLLPVFDVSEPERLRVDDVVAVADHGADLIRAHAAVRSTDGGTETVLATAVGVAA